MRDDINWISFYKEEVSATTGSAVGLSTTKITLLKGDHNLYMAKVLVTAFPVAWQETGDTATGTDKNTANVGDTIYLESLRAMDKFSAIGVGGTAVLAATYYKAC